MADDERVEQRRSRANDLPFRQFSMHTLMLGHEAMRMRPRPASDSTRASEEARSPLQREEVMKRRTWLLGALFVLLWSAPANADNRIIVRTTLGLKELQTLCLLQTCTVVGGLEIGRASCRERV